MIVVERRKPQLLGVCSHCHERRKGGLGRREVSLACFVVVLLAQHGLAFLKGAPPARSMASHHRGLMASLRWEGDPKIPASTTSSLQANMLGGGETLVTKRGPWVSGGKGQRSPPGRDYDRRKGGGGDATRHPTFTSPAQPRCRKKEVIMMYKEALKELKNGQIDTAENLFRRCLSMDRKDAHTWLQLGKLAARKGQMEDAQNYFLQGVNECPKSVHLLQAWALHESKLGNVNKARELFERGMGMEPGNPYIAHAWGTLERREGQPDQAKHIYKDSLRIAGPWAQLYIALAETEVESGRPDLAREHLQEGVKTCSENVARVLVMWAKLEEGNFGDTEMATSLLEKAREEASEDYWAPAVMLAHLEVKKGNQARAIEVIQSSKKEGAPPEANAALRNVWASLEAKAGNVSTAIKLLEEAKDGNPPDYATLQTLANLEAKQGRYDRARELFAQSVAVTPSVVAYNAWAIMEESVAQELRGGMRDVHLGRARKLFGMAMQCDPSHGPVYNAYGKFEDRLGNVTGARSIFQMGTQMLCSDVASVYNGWAALEMRHGQFEKARDILQKGLREKRIGRNVAFLYHALGMLELKLGRIDEAGQVLEEALKVYPRSSQICVAAALVAERNGNITAARNLFKKGVQVDRLHHHAWQAWGVMEHRLGNTEMARSLFEMGLSHNRQYGALWQAYGVLEYHEKHTDKARTLFEEGLKCDARHPMLYQAWACLEARTFNYDKARELIKEGLRYDPSHGAFWGVYGHIEDKCGLPDEARMIFETGVKHAPDHAPLWVFFADFEKKYGFHTRARELFEKAISIDRYYERAYHGLALLEVSLNRYQAYKATLVRARKVFGPSYEFPVREENVEFRVE